MMLSRAEAQTLADVFELCINQKIILSLLLIHIEPNWTLHCGNCRLQELSVTLTDRWGYFEEEKNTTRQTFFFFLWVFIYLFDFYVFYYVFFFYSKEILRYSQYNGIYFIWNDTGEGDEIQLKTKQTNQQKPKKEKKKTKEMGSKAVLTDTTVKTINRCVCVCVHKWSLWSQSSYPPSPRSQAKSCSLHWQFRRTRQQKTFQSRHVPTSLS